MKVFVCIKQVPDTEAKIKLDSQQQVDTAGVKWVMNPYDEYAVEEAIKLREAQPGTQVWVITLGPKARAGEVLRTALAMGADEGILIDAPISLDSAATAEALAKAIAQEADAKIVLLGSVAIDDNAASVGPMLSEFLKMPHTTVVTKFTWQGESVLLERESEGGTKEIVQLTLPAVVGVTKGLNMPRYASLPGIMKAKKKVLKELSAESLLGGAAVPRTRIKKVELPPDKPAVKIMAGEVKQQVAALVQLLRDEAKVL